MTSSWDDSGQLPWLEEHDITLVRGSGRLDGARLVTVALPNGEARRLVARRAVVIATGALIASEWFARRATQRLHGN